MGKIFPTLELEKKLWSDGYKFVAGLDEAGRGPWAGPVTAGAVVVRGDEDLVPSVTDSKKLNEKTREEAYEMIVSKSLAWGVGIVDASEIDEIGIQKSVQKAMMMAIEQVEKTLGEKVNYLIIDGKGVLTIDPYINYKVNKGDSLHYSISAASIIAKVTRDRIMKQMHEKYPQYGFDRHVGYGTKLHIESLQKYGICEIHRQSYKPIKNLLEIH